MIKRDLDSSCYTLSARRVKARRTPLSGVRADQTELPWRCGTARNRVATAAKVERDYAPHPRNELSSPLDSPDWPGKSVVNIYLDTFLCISQTDCEYEFVIRLTGGMELSTCRFFSFTSGSIDTFRFFISITIKSIIILDIVIFGAHPLNLVEWKINRKLHKLNFTLLKWHFALRDLRANFRSKNFSTLEIIWTKSNFLFRICVQIQIGNSTVCNFPYYNNNFRDAAFALSIWDINQIPVRMYAEIRNIRNTLWVIYDLTLTINPLSRLDTTIIQPVL